MHVDNRLQILVLVNALLNHFDQVLAVLNALLSDFILIFEPLLGHLGSAHLDLGQPHVVQFHVDFGKLSAYFHHVVVVGLVADFIIDFGQDVRSALDQCKSSRIVCLDNLQLLVHLRDSRLDLVMLRHVPVADEKLQRSVHLCVAKLEDFDCVGLAFKLCD